MFLPHELKSDLYLISNRRNIESKSQIQTKPTKKTRREAKKKGEGIKRVKSKGKREVRDEILSDCVIAASMAIEWQDFLLSQAQRNSKASSGQRSAIDSV